jgi:hypothetical protein
MLPMRLEYHMGGGKILFRWYPDDSFSESGAREASPREIALLQEHGAQIGSEKWWDISKPTARKAWLSLAAALGPQRALHLLRRPGNASLGGDARIGRIVALPKKVALFASQRGKITLLGTGKDIPANAKAERSRVSYTFKAFERNGWLADFTVAQDAGMGLALSEAGKVKLAADADWIIATGISDANGADEMEAFLRDQAANGKFELLEQDSPTNNSPGALSVGSRFVEDNERHLRRATHAEAGLTQAADRKLGSRLLADALGLSAAVTDTAINAADTAWDDARAMLQVLGPILMDNSVDHFTGLVGVTEADFLNTIVESMAARGVLPVLRFGRNPYGVAPVTRLERLGTEGVGDLLKKLCVSQRDTLSSLADSVVPVVRPGDADGAETLKQVLASQRVSSRLDVGEGSSSEVKPIGCPYVVGKAPEHEPATYLNDLLTKAGLPDPDSTDTRTPLLYRLALLSLKKLRTSDIVRSKIAPGSASMRKVEGLSPAERAGIDSFATRVNRLSQRDFQGAKEQDFPELGSAAKMMITRNQTAARGLARLIEITKREQGNAQLEVLMMETIDLLQHRVDAWAAGLAFQRIRQLRDAGVKGLHCGWYGFLGKLRPVQQRAPSSYLRVPSMAQTGAAALLRSAYLRHKAAGAFAINLNSRRTRQALTLLDMLKQGAPMGAALGLVGERLLNDKSRGPHISLLREKFPLIASGHRIFDGMAYLEKGVPSAGSTDKPVLDELTAFLREQLDALADIVLAEAVFQRSIGAADAANAWTQVLAGGAVPGEPQFIKSHRQGHGKNFRMVWLLPQATYNGTHPRAIAAPSVAALCNRVLSGFNTAKVVVDGGAPGQQFALAADLGMEAVDLVLGGENELLARCRARAGNPKLALKEDDVATQKLIDDADHLRTVLSSARPVEPSDLSAAASPDSPLTEAAEQAALVDAVEDLKERMEKLIAALDAVLNDPAANDDWFRKASFWGECACLASQDEADLVRGRLMERKQRLSKAQADAQAAGSAVELRASRNLLVDAMQHSLDGEALVILPTYVAAPATAPLLEASEAFDGTKAWFKERPKLADACKCIQMAGGARSRAVKAAATKDDTDDQPRPGSARSTFEGRFIGNDADLAVAAGNKFLGLVLDEWSMHQPSEVQTTGVVIHHDSPQAQAPASLLLAVQPTNDAKTWSAEDAAGMVLETIHWMKIRALSTMDSPVRLAPGMCQIPARKTANRRVLRIPEQQHNRWSANIGISELVSINLPAGALSATNINERDGFNR